MKFRLSNCLQYLILVGIMAGAIGCASIGNPSGGPRDEQPPRFVKGNPAPGSTNVPVNIGRINIDFDEIVNVKDAFSKVTVSPPSAQIPRVSSQGRRVTVNFQDTLASNTTYTINFGSAIEDNNESNPLENFSYTFSTAATTDSLRIAGIVVSAVDLEPRQTRLVGVFRIPDEVADSVYKPSVTDTLIFSRRFDRVTKTDDRGRFSIEGLAPGRYRIYSIDDTNNDFIYNTPTEEIAYSEEVIVPTSEYAAASDTVFNNKTGEIDTILTRQRTIYLPNDIILRSALSKRQQQYIKRYERIDSTRIVVVMGAAAGKLPDIRLVGDTIPLYHYGITEKRAENDSITIWLKDKRIIGTDTLRVALTYQRLDSLNQYASTTDTLRFTTDRKQKQAPRKNAAAAKREEGKKKASSVIKQSTHRPGEDTAETESAVLQGTEEKTEEKKSKNKKGKKDVEEDVRPKLLTINWETETQEVNKPLSFETRTPVARIDTSGIRLSQRVDTVWNELLQGATLPLRQDTLNPRKYYIDYKWEAGGEYKIEIDSLAITDIYGLANGKEETPVRVRAENEYGSLLMRLTDWPAGIPAFVELLNSSDRVIESVAVSNGIAYFPYLTAGKYYLRVIHDRNGDGRRDSSDIITGSQAEESYYYPKSINLKRNWNKDETWQVFATPVDAMKPEAILKNKPAAHLKGRKNNTAKEEEDEEDE